MSKKKPPRRQHLDSGGRPKPRRKRQALYSPYSTSFTAEPLRLLLKKERAILRQRLREREGELRRRMALVPKYLRGTIIEARIREELRKLERRD